MHETTPDTIDRRTAPTTTHSLQTATAAPRTIRMKIPRRFRTYCPHCHEHREHEVEKVRDGRTSGLRWDERKERTGKKTIGNAGRFSAVPGGEKPTKKTRLVYRCNDCGKAHQREGWRAGRLEFQE